MPTLIKTRPIVVLTGAGISKESGLDTFRDKDGIWAQVNVEDVATFTGFRRDPDKVHAFYNARRRNLTESGVEPNPAHFALARLEREWPGGVFLVTQNIDDLHERAGSGRVLHMHGELTKVRCVDCDSPFVWEQDLGVSTLCPECGRPGVLRPQVVWFGEVPLDMEEIMEALSGCGLFVSIGTSGSVYPAAGFVTSVRRIGIAHTVELNLEPSEAATMFAETRYGPASTLVPAFVDELLAL